VHQRTAFQDGGGGDRRQLVLLMTGTGLLIILTDTVFLLTLRQSARVVLQEELSLTQDEGTLAHRVHIGHDYPVARVDLVVTTHLVIRVFGGVGGDVVGTAGFFVLRVGFTVIGLADGRIGIDGLFAAVFERLVMLQLTAHDEVTASGLVFGDLMVTEGLADIHVGRRHQLVATLFDHRVTMSELGDVGVDVVTLTVQMVLSTALGVLVLVGVRLLFVGLATLLSDQSVFLTLVSTVSGTLAFRSTVQFTTQLLQSAIIESEIQIIPDIVTTGWLILGGVDEPLVDATLMFPGVREVTDDSVVITLTVLVLHSLFHFGSVATSGVE